MKLSGHRLEIDLPSGWEGRIFKHPDGEPTLHAANFPLPVDDADFGSGAVASLGQDGLFIVLTEYDAELAGQGLFAGRGLPLPLRLSHFSPRTLQRRLPGQAGVQRFFTASDRAFCLYVVIGTRGNPEALVGQANRILGSVLIAGR